MNLTKYGVLIACIHEDKGVICKFSKNLEECGWTGSMVPSIYFADSYLTSFSTSVKSIAI